MKRSVIALALAALLLAGCGEPAAIEVERPERTPKPTEAPVETPKHTPAPKPTPEPTPALTPALTPEPTPEPTEEPAVQYTVVIDPGHQSRANLAQEPVGPGAAETKYKASGGTAGRTTGLAEYELNLQVSLLLRDILEQRGYRVVMTRESNDVDLSNIDRAEIANAAGADACIRIHANGSEDSRVSGVLTICMTANSPYCPQLYARSRALSEAVLDGVVAAAGARREQVWETDTMTGINWSQVPVTILEMGYMTNPEEDRLLADPAYQQRIALGAADGLDAYFAALDAPAAQPTEPPTAENRLAPLQRALQAELDTLSSRWDLWAEDLSDGTGFRCTRNLPADGRMVSASLIKLFIMAAVFDRIEAGTMEESAVWNDLWYMITISDNESANRLLRRLGDGDGPAGRAAVTAWAAAMGWSEVQVNRMLLEDNGTENYVSAPACAGLLRSIYDGTCVSAYASGKMLELLRGQTVNDRIPAGLPAGVTAAHKTGNLYQLCVADVGIVFGPECDFILCAICNDPYTDAGATAEIAKLTDMVYRALE